jgi:transcriptional regulator GlxA family with amidase domain
MGALYDLARFQPHDDAGAQALVSNVIDHLASSIEPWGQTPDIAFGALSASALLDRMHGGPAIKADVNALAAGCGLSRASFYRRFASVFGASPHDHLIRSRLEFSKAALVRGCDSIAVVADAAGFADQAHFTRTFTARIGLPPGAYADHFGAV